jgi:hypothetical protein
VPVIAILLGVLIYRRCAGFEPPLRCIASVLPILATTLGIEIFLKILTERFFIFNDIRLARTFALYHGTRIYPGSSTMSAIVGTLHTPLSHILYWPSLFASTPISAIYVGSTIAFLFVFTPVVWLHFSRRPHNMREFIESFYTLMTCGFVMLQGSFDDGIRYCAFRIHADAPAICFAAISAGLIYKTDRCVARRYLVFSSFFAVLSVCCKQTLAPIVIGLCLFLWLTTGIRSVLRFVAYFCSFAAVLLSLLVVLFWPPKDLFFNILTLASHRPRLALVPGSLGLVRDQVLLDTFLAGLCLLLFFLHWLFYEHSETSGWRRLFREHRWLVFPLVGVALVPACIKARLTVGGGSNQIGTFAYFFILGTTLGLNEFMRDTNQDRLKSIGSTILATALIVVTFPAVIQLIVKAISFDRASVADVSIVYQYALKHPGKAYFPWNPLADFFAEHRFYHFDSALLDREVAGYGIDCHQFISGIPPNISVIAIPHGESENISRALRSYLSGWKLVEDAELPGWEVFQQPSAGSLTCR